MLNTLHSQKRPKIQFLWTVLGRNQDKIRPRNCVFWPASFKSCKVYQASCKHFSSFQASLTRFDKTRVSLNMIATQNSPTLKAFVTYGIHFTPWVFLKKNNNVFQNILLVVFFENYRKTIKFTDHLPLTWRFSLQK